MNHLKVNLAPGLYFLATPIGTARDITLRALDVLASAQVIAAEDTRSLRRLMEIHGVPLEGRRVLSYHDHSPAGSQAKLMGALAEGKSVAYASEAGMPLIADPGYELSRAAAEQGHMVTSAPGPSAVLAALTLAGLPTDAFFFAGFLPSAAKARQRRIAELAEIPGTLVIYESPRRVAAALGDLATGLGGDRAAALARELTKKFEEVRRGTLAELSVALDGMTLKGEIVLLVDRSRSEKISDTDLESDIKAALVENTVRDAADMVAKRHGIARRKVYQMALKLEND